LQFPSLLWSAISGGFVSALRRELLQRGPVTVRLFHSYHAVVTEIHWNARRNVPAAHKISGG